MLLSRKAEAKLANLLPILACRFGGEDGAGSVIGLRLTQEELAKMNLVHPRVGRASLGRFPAAGVLAVAGGRIVVLDSSGLATIGRRRDPTLC
jgi:CRP-like cAMP-binding protein